MIDTGFTKKLIELTITLGVGDFGETVGESVTIRGLRMTIDVINSGGPSMGMASMRVYGLPNEMMNKLTTIGIINQAIRIKNAILVAAGDSENGLQNVFQGVIVEAWADYNSAPDVAFNVMAYSGVAAAVKPVGAVSYEGATDVGGMMQTIANEIGVIFENNGVDVKLANPYLSGTNLERIRSLAVAADFRYTIDRQVLAIWPKNGFRSGEIPILSAETGMKGYPSLSSKGITVDMVFNWNMRYGGKVRIESSIPMACGDWYISGVSHSLSCEMPDGPWFTTIGGYLVN